MIISNKKTIDLIVRSREKSTESHIPGVCKKDPQVGYKKK